MSGAWTRSEIESLADPRSFMRAVVYRRQGRVEMDERNGDTITAVVRGSIPYRVELRRDPRVAWSCTCPVGDEGEFCKHCVAVALEEAGPEPAAKLRRRKGGAEPDLRKYLGGLELDALVDLVMEQVESDWRLRERLTARAVASGGGSLDVRTWKRRIDAVFGDSRHFVPYAEAGGWAQDIFEVIAAPTPPCSMSTTATAGSLTSPGGSARSTCGHAGKLVSIRSTWPVASPSWS